MRQIGTLVLAAVVLGLGTLGWAEPSATQPAGPAVDIPVRQVVLFSSGVGYFEHFGTVEGDGTAELNFKTQQINDILKSLVLQDLDHGTVSAVTYPSQDPVSKTLKSFQVDITGNPPLGELLNQLRGAEVKVAAQTENLQGTILGVEKKQKAVGDKGQVIETPVLNLLSDGTIRSVELADVRSLTLENAQLQEELNKALAALAQARDQDKKPVDIHFAGQGQRRVRIGYVVQTPVWKTSYRLILPTLKDEKPRLQGWAIVENQTDNDWKNVQLSLVSGRPISFVENLYQPLYIPRPTVEPELYASLRPQVYGEGMEQELGQQNLRMAGAPAPARAPSAGPMADREERLQGLAGAIGGYAGGGGGGFGGAPAASNAPMDAGASIASVASAAKVGELFQYTIKDPVTLPRQKSAMIPIISADVEAQKVSIYNPSVLARHPLSGAMVKNTTDQHWLGGPITVLEGGTYGGDAQIDNVPPGQERLISYGIDLQTLVDATKDQQTSAVVSGRIVKGVLEVTYKHVHAQDYQIQNKSGQDRTIIIEHPLRPGWKLTSEVKPMETTDRVYRFKTTVAANQQSTLNVSEQFVNAQELALLPGEIDQILVYARTGEISKDVRDALTKAVQMKQALADTERQIEQTQQVLLELNQDEGRMRSNINSLPSNAPFYTQSIKKLSDTEAKIEQQQSSLSELRKTRSSQQQDLATYLNGLNVG